MNTIEQAKAVVRAHLTRLDGACMEETARVLAADLAADHVYRGVHPFNTLHGAEALADSIYMPLKRALGRYQRRLDMFFAGPHLMHPTGQVRVVVMGHLLGFFTAPWLGIAPTGKAAFVPFTAFYRVVGNRIAETVEFLDILAVMEQAGVNPCTQTAAFLMSPGPMTCDGVHLTPGDATQTAKTFRLTQTMLTELAETMTSPADHMARYWHPDMNWFGPTGIGACYGFDGYRAGHTGPFEAQLDFIKYIPEEFATAEGHVAAFLWYPCLRMRNRGGYMGMPASDAAAEMRVVDLYRRDGDKLAENWIFIDMLHFLKQQGVDVLADLNRGA